MANKILEMHELYDLGRSKETPPNPRLCVRYSDFEKINTSKNFGLKLKNESKYKANPTMLVHLPDLKISKIEWEGNGNISYSLNVNADWNHPYATNITVKYIEADKLYKAYDQNGEPSYDISNHATDGHGEVFKNVSVSPIIIDENITSVAHMFCLDPNVTKVNLSLLDTSVITSLNRIFKRCINLKEVVFGDIDTSGITNFSGMLDQCFSLEKLDVSKFDTSNATQMNSMFCWSRLTSLDVRNFRTEKNVSFAYTFCGLANIKELDLSSFKTPSLTETDNMFRECRSLETIDMSNFDMTNVKKTEYMFYKCDSLKKIKVTNCNDGTKKKLLSVLGSGWKEQNEYLVKS